MSKRKSGKNLKSIDFVFIQICLRRTSKNTKFVIFSSSLMTRKHRMRCWRFYRIITASSSIYFEREAFRRQTAWIQMSFFLLNQINSRFFNTLSMSGPTIILERSFWIEKLENIAVNVLNLSFSLSLYFTNGLNNPSLISLALPNDFGSLVLCELRIE